MTGWERLVELFLAHRLHANGTDWLNTCQSLGTEQELQHARHDGVVSVHPQEARDWRAPVIVNVSEHRPNRPTSGKPELGHLNRSLAGLGDETSPNLHTLDVPGLLNGDRQRRGAHIRD